MWQYIIIICTFIYTIQIKMVFIQEYYLEYVISDCSLWSRKCTVDTFRLRQKGCYFADGTFQNIFPYDICCNLIQIWMKKMSEGRLSKVQNGLKINNDLAPNRWRAIIWTNDGLVYRYISSPLGLSELRQWFATTVCAGNQWLMILYNQLYPYEAMH